MELSRLSSLLAIAGALNIFYGVYGLTRMNAFIPAVTYVILMHSSAKVDSRSGGMARDGGIEGIRLQASDLAREVRAD